MRLKLYRAATMVEAMACVRRELGTDALILGTRRVADGVEITAAIEPAAARPIPGDADSSTPSDNEISYTPDGADAEMPWPSAAAPGFAARAATLRRPLPDFPSPGRAVAAANQDYPASKPAPRKPDPRREAALAWHGVPQPIAQKLTSGPLPFALAVTFRFAALDLAPNGPPLLMVGPAGAGKTLTTARLATRLVMAGQRPLVVTADAQRAGATEQLAAFTRLLGLNLLVASTPAALTRALAHREGGAPVLIDCPGVDALDPMRLEELGALAATAGGTMVLVMPAGLDPAEAAEIAAAHAAAGTAVLVANRLDAARRLGGIVAAAGAGLAFAEAGIGAGAADGLTPMTPDLLATRLLHVPDRRS